MRQRRRLEHAATDASSFKDCIGISRRALLKAALAGAGTAVLLRSDRKAPRPVELPEPTYEEISRSAFGPFKKPGIYVHPFRPELGRSAIDLDGAHMTPEEYAGHVRSWTANALLALEGSFPEKMKNMKEEEINIHFLSSSEMRRMRDMLAAAEDSGFRITPDPGRTDIRSRTVFEAPPDGSHKGRFHIFIDASKITAGDPRDAFHLTVHEMMGNVVHMRSRMKELKKLETPERRMKASMRYEYQAHKLGADAMERIQGMLRGRTDPGLKRTHDFLGERIEQDRDIANQIKRQMGAEGDVGQ